MESPAPLPVLSAAPSSVVETPSTASAPLSAPPVSPPAVSSPAPEAIVGANDATTERLQEHILSTAPTTERLQSIQRMVADQLGDAIPPEFSANVLQSIPVQRSEEQTSELQSLMRISYAFFCLKKTNNNTARIR